MGQKCPFVQQISMQITNVTFPFQGVLVISVPQVQEKFKILGLRKILRLKV